MEDIHRGSNDSCSDEQRFMYCDPCKYDERLAIADTFCFDCKEYLCPQCKHFHTKLQATRNHSLSGGYVQHQKETKELLLKQCDIHRTSEVKFYCHSHKCVLCSICKASIHSGCTLQPITEIIHDKSDKHYLTLARDSITDLIQNFQTSIDLSTNLMTDIEKVAREYKASLSSMKDRMNSLLDQAIVSLSTKEKEIKTEYAEKTESDQLSVLNDALDDLQTVQKNVQAVLDANDTVAIFSAKLKALKVCEEYGTVKRKLQTQSNRVSIDFTEYKQLIDTVEGTILMCEDFLKPSVANHATTETVTEDNMHHESQMSDNADVHQGQLHACFTTIQMHEAIQQIAYQNKLLPTTDLDSSQVKDSSTCSPLPLLDPLTVRQISGSRNFCADTNSHTANLSDMSQGFVKYEASGKNIPLIKGSNESQMEDKAAKGHAKANLTENNARKSLPMSSDSSEKPQEKASTLYSNIVKSNTLTFANMRLAAQKITRVNVVSDKNPCDITGSVFLPDGRLVLCDHNNMSVKLLNRSFEMTNTFRMDSKPWDVAVTGENQVAVTLPLLRVVRFLNLAEENDNRHKLFQVRQNVWGIDSFGETVVIALHDISNSNGAIEIRKHNGFVLRQIKTDSLHKPFFKSPGYVTVDKRDGKIFVIDGKKNAIMCFEYDGTLVRNYENAGLRWPRKIVSDSDNNLLICSRFSDSIKFLAPTNNLKTFLENENCTGPQTMSYRDSDKVIVIGRNLKNEILLLKYASK